MLIQPKGEGKERKTSHRQLLHRQLLARRNVEPAWQIREAAVSGARYSHSFIDRCEGAGAASVRAECGAELSELGPERRTLLGGIGRNVLCSLRGRSGVGVAWNGLESCCAAVASLHAAFNSPH